MGAGLTWMRYTAQAPSTTNARLISDRCRLRHVQRARRAEHPPGNQGHCHSRELGREKAPGRRAISANRKSGDHSRDLPQGNSAKTPSRRHPAKSPWTPPLLRRHRNPIEGLACGSATCFLSAAMRRFWPWLCAILSGALLTLCYPPADLGGLSWLALTPLVSALWFSEPWKNARRLALAAARLCRRTCLHAWQLALVDQRHRSRAG